MSKCDLAISFEDDKRDYQIGDTVRGTVKVDVNAPCTCDNLTLGHQWRTHGRGNRDVGPTEPIVLFTGQWEEPGTYTYPFELKMPAGPLTYRGNYINVDWYLDARADIPWAIDPKAQEEVILTCGDYSGELIDCIVEDRVLSIGRDWSKMSSQELAESKNQNLGWAFAISFVLLCVGGPFVWEGVSLLLEENRSGVLFILVGCVFFFPFGQVLKSFVVLRLAERKLGRVDLSIQPTLPRPGDELKCSVRFSPKMDAQVNSVTITLKGTETAVSGSGTSSVTHTSLFHNSPKEVMAHRQIHKGESVALETKLTLPPDATPSFRTRDNRIGWHVFVHIDIPGWPDWKSEQHFRVG
jgi:hypothetical protein